MKTFPLSSPRDTSQKLVPLWEKRGSIKFVSSSEKQTQDFAKKMASKFKSSVIALTGELGAGKTTFVQGFAEGLEIKDKIISPTFVLIREHQIPRSLKIFYHIDLYRVERLQDLGLEEILNDPENIVLIEWAEKIKDLLPKNTTHIKLETLARDERKISVAY